MAVFLLAFIGLLSFVSFYYLLPAADAAANATPVQRRQLSAYSALLMAVILVILCCGLILTFKIGRYFIPKPSPRRQAFPDIDPWTESARRMPTPPPADDDQKIEDDNDANTP